MDDAALILVILVVESAGLKTVRVLSVEQLCAQKCLIHLLGIICRLRKVLLILVLRQLTLMILLEAVALLICRMRAVELLFSKKEFLGLKIQRGISSVALRDEPIVFDASGHRGHNYWKHMLVTAADS